jgi:hypothetical protein
MHIALVREMSDFRREIEQFRVYETLVLHALFSLLLIKIFCCTPSVYARISQTINMLIRVILARY